MSENTLRKAVIKLAYENPELREHLIPLIREARNTVQKSVDEDLKDHLFTHPETHNKVKFKSLPPEEQAKIRKRLLKKHEGLHQEQGKQMGGGTKTWDRQKALNKTRKEHGMKHKDDTEDDPSSYEDIGAYDDQYKGPKRKPMKW